MEREEEKTQGEFTKKNFVLTESNKYNKYQNFESCKLGNELIILDLNFFDVVTEVYSQILPKI